jgi:hypothetical protein
MTPDLDEYPRCAPLCIIGAVFVVILMLGALFGRFVDFGFETASAIVIILAAVIILIFAYRERAWEGG